MEEKYYMVFQTEPERLLCSNGDLIIKEINPEEIEKHRQDNNLTMYQYAIIKGELVKPVDEPVGFMSVRNL